MALSFESSTEELYDKVYGPLQIWLQQNAIAYPWSSNLQDLMQQAPPKNLSSNPAAQAIFEATLPDSYAVWVSEVMLQQTQVQAAKPFFLTWMARWPNLEALAKAPEQEVLKYWEGLGYYNRVINLHKCARLLCQKSTSKTAAASLPNSAAELRQLPGIGIYIAAAVASISYNEAILALDTNGKRILSRLYQCQPSLRTERLWQEQHRRAIALTQWRGSANISLIQLGQQLCRSKQPSCSICPLRSICPAASKKTQAGDQAGTWAEFPKVQQRIVHKIASQRILCLDKQGRILLMQNRNGHLKHLWRFPTRKELALFFHAFPESGAESLAAEESGEELQCLEYIGSFQHAYLQTREKVEIYRLVLPDEFTSIVTSTAQTNWKVASPLEMQQLTLAGPYRKFYREKC